MGWRSTLARSWNAGLVLAFLAVCLRAAIPAGYMVAQDHGPQLVICTGHAAAPGDPGGKPASDPHKGDTVCVFAAAHLAAPAPDGPAVLPWTTAVAEVAPFRRPDPTPGRGLAAPPPPATGPPIHL